MEDVTGVFDHYRITVRSIWNTGFWPDPAFQDWEAQERFEEVSRILFDELVLTKLDLEWQISDIFRKPMPFFRIQPTSDYGCPVMIDREGDALTGGGVWNDPVNRLRPLEAELHFIQFFDWDKMNYIDLQYYMAGIAVFAAQPHLVGRRALIDRQYLKVFRVKQGEA
jgi:hypothetical protein